MSSPHISEGIQKRAWIMACCLVAFFLLLLLRLALVTTRDHQELSQRADRAHLRPAALPAPRGTIFDRTGTPLASSALWYRVSVDCSQLRRDHQWVYDLAEHYYHKSHAKVEEAIRRRTTLRLDWFASEARRKEILEKLGQVEDGHKPLALHISSHIYGRAYGEQPQAPQLLGYLDADGRAQAGLERTMNSVLAPAAPDASGVILSLWGTPLPFTGGSPTPVQPGNSLVLTLDARLQQLAQSALEDAVNKTKADSGLVLAMDPRTGEILVDAQWPTFNPLDRSTMVPLDRTSDPDDPHEVDPTRNLALDWRWEPGSFMKPLLVAGALQAGVITPQSIFVCKGSWSPEGKTTVSCYNHEVHGTETPGLIIAHSCNVGAAKIATRMGARKLVDWLQQCGLDQAPAMDAGRGAVGMLGEPRRMHPLDVASLGFGQGSVLTTPMQMFSALCGLANGGVIWQPHTVKAILSPAGTVLETFKPQKRAAPASPRVADEVLKMMRQTVTVGTARRLDLPGYHVCGKTSTAQVSSRRGGYIHTPGHLVVGFFGVLPEENPQLAIMVIIKYPKVANPSGSGLAGPVFKELAQQAVRYLRIPPSSLPGTRQRQ